MKNWINKLKKWFRKESTGTTKKSLLSNKISVSIGYNSDNQQFIQIECQEGYEDVLAGLMYFLTNGKANHELQAAILVQLEKDAEKIIRKWNELKKGDELINSFVQQSIGPVVCPTQVFHNPIKVKE